MMMGIVVPGNSIPDTTIVPGITNNNNIIMVLTVGIMFIGKF